MPKIFSDDTAEKAKGKKVFIYMGSDSDLEVVHPATVTLKQIGIPYFIQVVSAHRTPHDVERYAWLAKQSDGKVIIAAAGGAAHLPGMLASFSTLPVIGIPVKTSTLSGVDSLYSIVQMPAGVPVAAMAINGAENAALLAAQIIGTSDPDVAHKLESHKVRLEDKVEVMRTGLLAKIIELNKAKGIE